MPRAEWCVAILPIDNRLDYVEFAWIDHKAIDQLATGLAAIPGIVVATTSEMLAALRGAGSGDARHRALYVLCLLNFDTVVHVRLAVDGAG